MAIARFQVFKSKTDVVWIVFEEKEPLAMKETDTTVQAFKLMHAVICSTLSSGCILSFWRFIPFDHVEKIIMIITLEVIKGKCSSQWKKKKKNLRVKPNA